MWTLRAPRGVGHVVFRASFAYTQRPFLVIRVAEKQLRRRPFSSAFSSSKASNATKSSFGPLSALADELDKICPSFDVDASDITILSTPREFYSTLEEKILSAKKRVYLSTLYIGTSSTSLISALRTALARNSDLKVSILTDALRGTRETPKQSCASMLVPLVTEFGPERVRIRMWHTPNLVGWRKRVIPRRFNEGWGLQHMKLYGFDDEVMLSGANLSKDYFEDRQDRYVLFRSRQVADYFWNVHDTVSQLSFDVQPDSRKPGGYAMTWTNAIVPSPLENVEMYRAAASAAMSWLTRATHAEPSRSASSTRIYPIFQLAPISSSTVQHEDHTKHPPLSTENLALARLLSFVASPAAESSRVTFTSGYFNPSSTLARSLLSSLGATTTTTPDAKETRMTIIAAHPDANGFLPSSFPSSLLPAAYTYLASLFLARVGAAGLSSRVSFREWRRGKVGEKDGWTYHAKGIWMTLPAEGSANAQRADTTGPSITIIGSSNFSTRAERLDLEAGVVLLTTQPDLQGRLRGEEQVLLSHTRSVEASELDAPDRRASWVVRGCLWIVGALGVSL
ncbi:hypothetical protein MRB53_038025 [Persea americana]|nr:hypothetical protein MRB53_038025 [Persea americana]